MFTRELPSWTGEYEIRVPAARMAEGINDIAAFDAAGKCVAERYFFMPADAGDSLYLSFDDHAGRRENITLQIHDPQSRISPDDMIAGSISVAASVTGAKTMTASDYQLLGSEFRHLSGAPQLKDNFPWLTPEARNIFLLGIKSEWIDWDRITAGHCDPPLFPEEVNGRYHGRYTRRPTGSHRPKEKLTAFLVGWGRRTVIPVCEKRHVPADLIFFLERKHETDEYH
ncbi:MAG: hypothetical protein MZV63_17885 [Marinilabiliales bacterium]|nr:hypothetical protein [Marinilabiliales bacterium]